VKTVRILILSLAPWAMLLLGAVWLLKGPFVLRVPKRESGGEASVERLRESVRFLCEEVHPRDYLHASNLDRAAGWIEARMRQAGLEVSLQEYRLREGTYRNVIARRPGSEPGAGAVVIGAHYDAVAGTPGADDNASGVAVLMELARTLPPGTNRRTWYLVAFSTEEPPFYHSNDMGSYVFARDLAERGEPVHVMVALDLVGFFTSEPGSQAFPLPGVGLLYPSRGDFIVLTGDLGASRSMRTVKRGMMSAGTIPVRSVRAPAFLGWVHLSDHYSFRRLGMQGVLVTDSAMFRNRNYHGPGDTPETLDYAGMAGVVHAVRGALLEADR